MDRTARVAKVITDGDLSERLHRRIGWMAADRAAQLTAVLAAVLQAAPADRKSAAAGLGIQVRRSADDQGWAGPDADAG